MLRTSKPSVPSGFQGSTSPTAASLQLRDDVVRAWLSGVVEAIPTVPPRALAAHLDEPRPHLLGRCGNGHRVRELRSHVGEKVVARQAPGTVRRRSKGMPQRQAGMRDDAGARGSTSTSETSCVTPRRSPPRESRCGTSSCRSSAASAPQRPGRYFTCPGSANAANSAGGTARNAGLASHGLVTAPITISPGVSARTPQPSNLVSSSRPSGREPARPGGCARSSSRPLKSARTRSERDVGDRGSSQPPASPGRAWRGRSRAVRRRRSEA